MIFTSYATWYRKRCGWNFFDHRGLLRDEYSEKLRPNYSKGGYLHIESVEVDNEHRGNTLGLMLMKAALDFQPRSWSVAFIKPYPLKYKPETDGPFSDVVTSLSRHFSRLGFKQMGESEPESKYWALEASQYNGSIASKEEAAATCVAVSPTAPILSEISKEIRTLIYNFGRDITGTVMQVLSGTWRIPGTTRTGIVASEVDSNQPEGVQITFMNALADIINRGGDLNEARCLHVAVSNGKADLLPVLVAMGARVNERDNFGSTPLHAAAEMLDSEAVSTLLLCKADKNVCDDKNERPLDSARGSLRRRQDFFRAFSMLDSASASRVQRDAVACFRLLQ